MRDAFGVERTEISKANLLRLVRPAAKTVGHGPGAQLTPGASVALKPKKAIPPGNFVHADEGAIKAFTTQRQRSAMKASFR